MKKLIFLFLVVILTSLNLAANDQSQGYLVIIGGGDRPEAVMKKILELARPEPKILIIPNASSEPVETGERLKKEFSDLGSQNIFVFIGDKEKANDEEYLSQLSDFNVVFFSGGDQNRLTKDLLSTKLLDMIKITYSKGGVISGTSAGAAVMSQIMITGDETKNKDTTNPFCLIESGNVVTAEGFGFLDDVIIDQHFIKRKRLNRLISLILENPSQLGVGIDESTAIVVYPNRIFEVIGDGQVIVFDARKSSALMKNEKGKIGRTNVSMHVLLPGQKFDLKTRKVIQ
ncbi:MAG: cyanophycinase [Candidatus Aminicenantes bacterium]|nr:cyanophycinase [Candidatus Aminicenantes bacterium]